MDNMENGENRKEESITLYFTKDGFDGFIKISKTEDTDLKCIKMYNIKLYIGGMRINREVYIDGLDFWEKLQSMPYKSIDPEQRYIYGPISNFDHERFMYVLLGREFLSIENLQEKTKNKYLGAIVVGDNGQYRVDRIPIVEDTIEYKETSTKNGTDTEKSNTLVKLVDEIAQEIREKALTEKELDGERRNFEGEEH